MKLRWIDASGISRHEMSELEMLRSRGGGFVWLDVVEWSDEAETLLRDRFGFHPIALRDCRERNHTPRVHGYTDHLFVVIHAPLIGTGGHVHYLELDQFVGDDFLVTVHGPLNPAVPLEEALRETRGGRRGWRTAGCGRPPRSDCRTRSFPRSPAREADMVAEIARAGRPAGAAGDGRRGRGAAGVPRASCSPRGTS